MFNRKFGQKYLIKERIKSKDGVDITYVFFFVNGHRVFITIEKRKKTFTYDFKWYNENSLVKHTRYFTKDSSEIRKKLKYIRNLRSLR